MRLKYDEAQRHLGKLKCRLANIEDKMLPGQPESDKDRYAFVKILESYFTVKVL